MNKTLVLVGKNVDVFFKREIDNVSFCDTYNRKIPFPILRVVRNLNSLVYHALGRWKKSINEYDTIILFDGDASPSLVKWVEKHANKNCRLIFYYRNKVKACRREFSPLVLSNTRYELWSYNIHDCEEFGLKYNNQVLNYEIVDKIAANIKVEEPVWDVVFLGAAKGREEQLADISEYCERNGLSAYIYVVGGQSVKNNKCVDGKLLSYAEYIELVINSRAVLDVVTDRNWGLTLRPIEAFRLNKKLITNYRDIDRYDFYNSDNIFCFDESLDGLSTFLNGGFVHISDSIVDGYDIKEWFKHFGEENKC